MGQQQLLLLVLGIVIVGLAVVAGINAFSENQEKSTRDAIVNEGMRIATDVQSWRLKPDAFGGGGGNAWPDGLGGAGTSGDTPWGAITFDSTTTPASLTLNPAGSAETATINIPADGSSPSLNENSDGEIWTTPSQSG